jgi:hypothetical protein
MYGAHQVPRPAGTSILNAQHWDRMVNHYHITSITAGPDIKFDQLAEQYGIYLVKANPD